MKETSKPAPCELHIEIDEENIRCSASGSMQSVAFGLYRLCRESTTFREYFMKTADVLHEDFGGGEDGPDASDEKALLTISQN